MNVMCCQSTIKKAINCKKSLNVKYCHQNYIEKLFKVGWRNEIRNVCFSGM